MVDFGLCSAARKKLPTVTVNTIVKSWAETSLSSPEIASETSSIELEVEKYVSLDERATLSYSIGAQIHKKVS